MGEQIFRLIDAHRQRCAADFLRSVDSNPDAYSVARLVTPGDGAERGVRVVEFRTASGADVEITTDRGGDIGRLALNGRPLSWHALRGLRAPWLLNSASKAAETGIANNTCGIEFTLETSTLTYVQLLRMTSPSLYGIGLEPCTTRAQTRRAGLTK